MMTQQGPPNCERKEELIEYLYDEMPPSRRALFAEHVSNCPNCSSDLQGMEHMRSELRVWDVNAVPHMEIIIPRPKLAILKELLGMFPVWSRAMMATATAAATILIALGTLSLFKQTSGALGTLANTTTSAPVHTQPATIAQTPPHPALQSDELKALVSAEVARAVEQERQNLRAQMAALDVRDREQRAQLQTITRQLQTLNLRHQEMLAAQQPSIRSIFTEFEPSSER